MASLGQMSDYEVRLVRIFKTVVECGGFTAAETALGISRSAISQHMNDLEGRLGFSLCQRGRGGFSLTEEGKEIYQVGLTLLTALEAFKSDGKRITSYHQGRTEYRYHRQLGHLASPCMLPTRSPTDSAKP